MGIKKALAALGFGAIICTGSVIAITPADVQAATKSNVVIIYLDDVSQNQRRLWCDENRTPSLAQFCDRGVEFRNAYGSTPVCGPARKNLLTGKYSHNNGFTDNANSVLDSLESSLNVQLQKSGYRTIYVGKPMNGFTKAAPTRKSVYQLAKGWNHFDVIHKHLSSVYQKFYSYYLWTRKSYSFKGTKTKDHSTLVIGRRIAKHIRNAPKATPVFAVASLPSGHTPNIPVRTFVGHPKCRNVNPWTSPSYNEQDVSDKPNYVQDFSRLSQKSYDLTSRCEEMMGVDRTFGKIKKALKETGRYRNTLFIFTSDNGWLMGEHRKIGKRLPYAAPVPLYMTWPARLGNSKRVIKEPVSNVDFAPTLCALADCIIPGADGMNLLPLLTGKVNRLNREFIYLEYLHTKGSYPAWYGLVTTKSYSQDTTWTYTKYKTGEAEHYDLTNDPWQLENLAGKDANQSVQKELNGMLMEVVNRDNVKFIN